MLSSITATRLKLSPRITGLPCPEPILIDETPGMFSRLSLRLPPKFRVMKSRSAVSMVCVVLRTRSVALRFTTAVPRRTAGIVSVCAYVFDIKHNAHNTIAAAHILLCIGFVLKLKENEDKLLPVSFNFSEDRG